MQTISRGVSKSYFKWLFFFFLAIHSGKGNPVRSSALIWPALSLFVKWCPEQHNVMSTCINSFPKRGVQYSGCVCPGTIYLFFSFISEGLQVPLPLKDSALFCNFSFKTTFERTLIMSHKSAFREVIKKVNISRDWIKMLHIKKKKKKKKKKTVINKVGGHHPIHWGPE